MPSRAGVFSYYSAQTHPNTPAGGLLKRPASTTFVLTYLLLMPWPAERFLLSSASIFFCYAPLLCL
jgi:hypothetical protein